MRALSAGWHCRIAIYLCVQQLAVYSGHAGPADRRMSRADCRLPTLTYPRRATDVFRFDFLFTGLLIPLFGWLFGFVVLVYVRCFPFGWHACDALSEIKSFWMTAYACVYECVPVWQAVGLAAVRVTRVGHALLSVQQNSEKSTHPFCWHTYQ